MVGDFDDMGFYPDRNMGKEGCQVLDCENGKKNSTIAYRFYRNRQRWSAGSRRADGNTPRLDQKWAAARGSAASGNSRTAAGSREWLGKIPGIISRYFHTEATFGPKMGFWQESSQQMKEKPYFFLAGMLQLHNLFDTI